MLSAWNLAGFMNENMIHIKIYVDYLFSVQSKAIRDSGTFLVRRVYIIWTKHCSKTAIKKINDHILCYDSTNKRPAIIFAVQWPSLVWRVNVIYQYNAQNSKFWITQSFVVHYNYPPSITAVFVLIIMVCGYFLYFIFKKWFGANLMNWKLDKCKKWIK